MALDPSAPPYFPSSHLTLSAETSSIYYAYTPLLPQPHPQLEFWHYYISPNYDTSYQHPLFPTKQLSLGDIVETSPSTPALLPPLNTALEPEEDTNMQQVQGAVKEVVAVEKKCRGLARGAGGHFSSMMVRSKCSRIGQRNHSFLPLPPPEDLQFKEQDEGCGRTTVMIRNIPNKINKMALLEILDAHCYKENQKLHAGDENSGSLSEFNFLYLPMDFRSGSNLGYSFVNFTSPEAARRLHRDLHNKSWNMFGSRKICEITYARVQGLASLQAHFKNSVFNCESDDYLPVVFEPCRNGLGMSDQYYAAKRYYYQKLRRA